MGTLSIVIFSTLVLSCNERGCTLEYYSDVLVLHVAQEQGEPTTEALYEIELRAEGIYEIEIMADLHAGDVKSELIKAGESPDSYSLSVNENGYLEVTLASAHSSKITSALYELHVKVRSGGDVLADTDVHPEWESHQPGPKYCHKNYYTATVFLIIDEPPDPYTDTDSSTDTDTNEAAGSAY
ncbi:MAG: hypothetical protein R6V85_10310 [Polyangia bacterium]